MNDDDFINSNAEKIWLICLPNIMISKCKQPAKKFNVIILKEVNFVGINVLEDSEIREGIKIYSDWPTIPQLYIKNEFIGVCDIVKEMFEKGELQIKLKEKKIPYKVN